MKLLFAVLFFLLDFSGLAQQPDLEEVRLLYQKAGSSELAAEELETLLEPYGEEEPVLLAYKASGALLMAKHVGNPFKKMRFFKEGKEMLQRAITAAPEVVEIRFLRFAVQSEIPSFLGYKDNLEEDKAILLREVPRIEDEEIRNLVLPYLKNSDSLTENEKKQISTPKP